MLDIQTAVEGYRVLYALDTRPECTLYRATPVDDETQAVLFAALPAATPQMRQHFAHLATIIATVGDPALLPLHHHFAHGDAYYLVCTAPDSTARLANEAALPSDPATALGWLVTLCTTINIVQHSTPALLLPTLHPTDIFVADDAPQPVRMAPVAALRPYASEATPYTAPELHADDATPTPASIVYTLGVLAYHWTTGYYPASAQQQANDVPYQSPHRLNPAVSPAVARVIERCLATAPPDRYPDVAALLPHLRAAALLLVAPVVASAASAASAAPRAAPAATPTDEPTTTVAPPTGAAVATDELTTASETPAAGTPPCLIWLVVVLSLILLGMGGALFALFVLGPQAIPMLN